MAGPDIRLTKPDTMEAQPASLQNALKFRAKGHKMLR